MRFEERETFRLHAGLSSHKRRVMQAREIVRDAMSENRGTWAVGLSGGKDSVALLDIALDAGWHGPAYHFWYTETPAEQRAFVDALCRSRGVELIEHKVAGAFDVFDRVGFFVEATTDEQAAAQRQMKRQYKQDALEVPVREGWAGMFWGLRAEESKPRKITLRKKGVIYRTLDRPYVTACPLAWWSGLDVWARIVSRGLPWMQRYDRADDRFRERSEETWLDCPDLWANGMGARMRHDDPDRWAELVKRWPELSRWG